MTAALVLRRTVTVRTDDGARLHAVVDGPDDAPVTLVLAHGWTLTQAAWDDVAGRLAPKIAAGELRLARYDQRGHGRSTWPSPTRPPAGQVTIDRLGEDLAAVLDAVAPAGPVVLAGHSMGGMTIMCLAADRPELFGDRVRGVTLVSTAAGGLAPQARTPVERLRERLTPGALALALASAGAIERLRRLLPPRHPRHRAVVRDLLYGADATDAMVRAGAEIMHATPVRVFTEFLPALGALDKAGQLAALRRVPVEILVGDADRLTPERLSRRLAGTLPDAVLHVVPRTGHMLLQERPDLVTAAIERLLVRAAR